MSTGNAPIIEPGSDTGISRRGTARTAVTRSCGIPGLFDLPLALAPDGGLAAADRPDTSLTSTELAELVRRAGGEGLDVRILAPAGEQNLPTLAALADLLGRDLLVPQPGARLRYHGRNGSSGEDVTAVDSATGYPMDWVTVAPAGQVGSMPGWFDTARGSVVPRTGTVALPLTGGGVMLATRGDFVARRALAAELRSSHPELLTVGAAIRSGGFVVGEYGGRTTVCDGPGLAAVLAGIPLYGAQVRMWLDWPESAQERHRLADNLATLADVTGATVWAPVEGGRAELTGDCGDLRGLRAGGASAGWQAYGAVGPATMRSDPDGRLVPVGGVVVTGYPGVPLVSVPAARERSMAGRYASLSPADDLFRADLAVLADGRLAARYADGSLLAVSGGQFGQLLRSAGWNGAPVALLSTVSPERAARAQRHVTELARQLGCPVTIIDATRSAPDGLTLQKPRSGTDSGEPGRPVPTVPRQALVPWPSLAARAALTPVPQPVQRLAGIDRADPGEVSRLNTSSRLFAEPMPLSRFVDGPRLEQAGRSAPPHGIAWLPSAPQTNSEDFDVYLECPVDPDEALEHGVPASHLFLLGYLGGERLAARTSARYLLQVRVRPEGAVDVGASETVLPRSLIEPLRDSEVYLLPVAWLAKCRAVAVIRVDGPAQLSRDPLPEPRPLLARSTGADHGVSGLPAEALRWPRGSLRATVTRFATLPGDADDVGPWLRLYRRRPAPGRGCRMVQLRIDRGRAIDVAATATGLAGLSCLRSTAAELCAAGVDVLLPAVSYPHTRVLRAFRSDGPDWQRVPVVWGLSVTGWEARMREV